VRRATLCSGLSAALLCTTPGALWAQAEAVERQCGLMQRMGTMVEGVPAPWLHVLRRSAEEGPLSALPPGTLMVGCVRTDLVPGPNDDAVPALGVPLNLAHEGSRRSLRLELVEGRFRYQMLGGPLTEEERGRVEARLAEFQARRPPRP
jgi:hypothetical protein